MIYFNEERHIYYNADREIYDSPSKILKKYKPPFNAVEVAEGMVKKYGGTVEGYLAEWKRKRENSLDRGHRIHTEKEEEAYAKGVERVGETLHRVYNAEAYQITDLSQLADGVYPEINIWNHGRKVAGRPDKLVIKTINGVRYAGIYDYKTNGRIDKTSYQYKDGHYKKLLKPVEHLMDSNWNHYALQLSLYQWIMEAAGFVPGERQLIHIQHPVDFIVGQIQPPDTIYPIPYMKSEIISILEDYNRGRVPQYFRS